MTVNTEDKGEARVPVEANTSVGERAVKDTTKQFAAQLVVGAVAVGFSAWLNRLLPAKELALWPVCTSIGGLVATFASFGLGDTFVRLVPSLIARGEREEASAVLRTGLLTNVLACAVLSVAVYTLATPMARYLLHDVAQAPLVQSMAMAAFLQAVAERLSWAQSAVQQFGKKAITVVVTGVTRVPLAVALYLAMDGPRGVILALTIVPLLSCVLSLWWLWPHLRVTRRLYSWRSLLSFSLPYYGVSLIGLLRGRVNNLVIALLVKPEVLATYFVAESVSGYVDALNGFAIKAITPKIAEKNALEPAAARQVFAKCLRYAFIFLLPLHVMVAVAATPLLRLYGGAKYADAGAVLVVMCAGLFIGVLYQVHRAHIHVLAKPAHLFWLGVTGGAGNVISMLLLVPPLGALGAALSDGTVALMQLVISGAILRRTLRLIYNYRAWLSGIFASAVAGLLLWSAGPLWQEHAWRVLPLLVVVSLCYVLALTRQLTTSDVVVMTSALPARLRNSRGGEAVVASLTWLLVSNGKRET
ncbi:MAG: oligosaccharide flippase family protein [Armatimonadetes bacterium]|nr:oligosaccharide flippase family protein [Armatimonadota bacterium]